MQACADIHVIDERWQRIGDKEGGSRPDRQLGGRYQDKTDPGRIILVKQEEPGLVAKSIAEKLARHIMAALHPEHPHLFAEVEFAFANGRTTPDPTGDDVYVVSVLYKDYLDLYEDAYHANKHLHIYEPIRDESAVLPEKRPSYWVTDPIVDLMIRNGRYPALSKLFTASAFVGDRDVNTANVGTTPKQKSSAANVQETIIEGEKWSSYHDEENNHPVPIGDSETLVYPEVETVRVDFGAALENLDKRLHLFELYVRGTPNYFRTYPDAIFKELNFLEELIKLSCFPPKLLKTVIAQGMDEVTKYYGKLPLFQFALHIGMKADLKKKYKGLTLNRIQEETDAHTLAAFITQFLQENLCARLKSAHQEAASLAAELKTELRSLATNTEIEEAKNQKKPVEYIVFKKMQEKAKARFPEYDKDSKEKEITSDTEIEMENTPDDIILTNEKQETVQPVYTIQEKLQEKLIRLEEAISELKPELENPVDSIEENKRKRKYCLALNSHHYSPKIMHFFSDPFFELNPSIKEFSLARLLEIYPIQMKTLHDIFREVMELNHELGKERIKEKLHYLIDLYEEESEVTTVDQTGFFHSLEILFDVINLGIDHYQEKIKTNTSGRWARLWGTSNKAQPYIDIMISEEHSKQQKMICLNGILSEKFPDKDLQKFIIKELNSILEKDYPIHYFKTIIQSILCQHFSCDPSTLSNKDTLALVKESANKKLLPG